MLYIVTPAFVFETDAGGKVVYNDALVLDHEWDDLAAMETIHAARREAQERLRRFRNHGWTLMREGTLLP